MAERPYHVELEKARGWSIWWDPAIAPGQEFDRQIAEELTRAAAVLVVWTEDSVESRWVRGEARDGADRGILVPVRFGQATLPIDFRAIHTIDLGEGSDVARSPAFEEVIRAIGALLARSSGTRSTPAPASADASTVGSPAPSRAASRVGICVLAFANLGGEPDQDYLSDGLTGDIITELSRWRMLAVRPRPASSCRAWPNGPKPPCRAGEHEIGIGPGTAEFAFDNELPGRTVQLAQEKR